MEHVTIDDLNTQTGRATRCGLSAPLGLEHVAMNHYRIEPGARLAGLHAHEHQQEVFVVLRGHARFETLDGRVDVQSGEVIRFGPAEHKSGLNPGDGPTVVLALGAPPDGGDVFIPLSCPSCEHAELQLDLADGRESLRCPACDAGTNPACPDCGSADLYAVLDPDTDEPISECQECGTLFDL